MDASNELSGEWFTEGESLAESTEELIEEAAPPNLRVRFGLACAATGGVIAALLTVVRALA